MKKALFITIDQVLRFTTRIPPFSTGLLFCLYPFTSFAPYMHTNTNIMKALRFFSLALLVILTNYGATAQTLSMSSSNDRNKISYRSDNPLQSFNVETRGKIELTDDDKDIKSMSSDGYIEIEKTVFGSRRKIVITAEGNVLKREYYEGRTSLPFEPEGRKWLGEILPELVRTTTLGAEGRVKRFFAKGGTPAVLNEINEMSSDYVMSHYASLLMKQPVSTKDYPVIIKNIVDAIDSDHYRAQFLENSMDKFVGDQAAIDAVCLASGRMESDHYKTQVIKRALRDKNVSPQAMKSILAATTRMSSDHYITEVITTLLKQDVSDAVVSEAINASKAMSSDHYRSLVLRTALSKPNLSAVSYQLTLEAVRGVNSDHYKTEILKQLMRGNLANEQLFSLVDLSSSIGSDHYLTEIFTEVLRTQQLSDDAFKRLMDRVGDVSSDHYASVILRSALNRSNLNDAKLISILQNAGNIGSDHYITEVLTAAAPKVKVASPAVKDSYRAAAKRISSETYFGRALRAVE